MISITSKYPCSSPKSFSSKPKPPKQVEDKKRRKAYYQANLSNNELTALLKKDALKAQQFHDRQGVTAERAISLTPVTEHSNDDKKNYLFFRGQEKLLLKSRSERMASQSLVEQSRAKLVQAQEELDKVGENLPLVQKDFEEVSANFHTKIAEAERDLEIDKASRLTAESLSIDQDDTILPDHKQIEQERNLMLIKIEAKQQLEPFHNKIQQIEYEISKAKKKVALLKKSVDAITKKAERDLERESICARSIIGVISRRGKPLPSYWQSLQKEAEASLKIANISQRYYEPKILQPPNQVSRGSLPDETTYLFQKG
jgi:hypothetical protein